MVVCLMRKMRDFICVGKIRDVVYYRKDEGWCEW